MIDRTEATAPDDTRAGKIVDSEFVVEHGGIFIKGHYIDQKTLTFLLENDVRDIISVGYEQLQCNDEGLTDAGDATRIWVDRLHQSMGASRDQQVLDLLDPLVEAAFEKEFSWYRENGRSS